MEKFPSSPSKQNQEPRQVKEKEMSPDGKQKKKIERDKARVSPSRPLPELVTRLAQSSDDEDLEDFGDDELIEMTQVLDLSGDLEEFGDDVPDEEKQRFSSRRHRRRPKKKKPDKKDDNNVAEVKEQTCGRCFFVREVYFYSIIISEPSSERGCEWKALLFSTRHDSKMMRKILLNADGIAEQEKILILHCPIDTRGNNLLHEASNNGLVDRVRCPYNLFLLASSWKILLADFCWRMDWILVCQTEKAESLTEFLKTTTQEKSLEGFKLTSLTNMTMKRFNSVFFFQM